MKALIGIMLAVTVSACTTTVPFDPNNTTPDRMKQEFIGRFNGCSAFRTIMTDNWRLYGIYCGHRQTAIFDTPAGNCKTERRQVRAKYFPESPGYTVSCTGPITDPQTEIRFGI